MSYELDKLLEFIGALKRVDMQDEAIMPRAYDFALALCRSKEEARIPREISATLQVQIMDNAADLLKMAYYEINGIVKE